VKNIPVVSVVGESGAGKTTFLNCINGIYKPEEGDIRLRGKSIVGASPHVIARLGVGRTFQISRTLKGRGCIGFVEAEWQQQLFSFFSVACFMLHPAVLDRFGFFGNVDTHGAPCDTPSATDASRHVELIVPVRQLVRHPLTIS